MSRSRDPQESIRLINEQIARTKDLLNATQDLEKQEELLLKVKKLQKDAVLEELALIRKLEKEHGKLAGFVQNHQKAEEKKLEQLEKQIVKLEKIKKDTAELEKLQQKAGEAMGAFGLKANAFDDSLLGQLFSGEGASFGQKLKAIGKGVADTLKPANLFAQSLQAVGFMTKALILKQQMALTNFRASTGAVQEYDEQIVDLGKNHLSLGIDTKDASEATQALFENLTKFTQMSKTAQRELSLTVATMSKFGVSAQTSSNILETMNRVMGMTSHQSSKAMGEMIANAQKLGLSVHKTMKDFEASREELAKFGTQGVRVFKQLQVAAKATGLEVSNLLNITKQFETFEGAGDAVGRLNAILKGPFLDSMQMLKATGDPRQQLLLLKQAFDRAGVSAKNMSPHLINATASALKMKKGDLMKLLSTDINKLSASADAQAKSQKEMAEMAKKTQNIFTAFKGILMSFAISLQPVVEWVKGLMQSFLELNETMGGYLVPILVGVLATLTIYSKILVPLIGMIRAFGIAQAIAGLFSAKKAVADTAATGSTVALSTATTASSAVMASAIPVMLAFGAAVLMVGGGIALLGLGIKLVVDSFTNLFESLAKNVKVLPIVVKNIFLLGTGLMGIGAGGFMAGIALPLVALGFGALALSLALIKTADLEAVSMLFSSITKFSSGTVNALKGVAMQITAIANAMDKVPTYKAIAFATTMQSANIGGTTQTTTAGGGIGGKTEITLKIGERTLKKFIIDTMNAELNPRTV